GADRPCQIIGLSCRIAQSLHRIPAFGDRLSRLVDRAAQLFFGLHRAVWQQLENGLEPQQQTVKALQQSVMQLERNACALVDTRVQRHLELMTQLLETPLVARPQQRYKEHRTEGAK